MTIKVILNHNLPHMNIELTHDSREPTAVQYHVTSVTTEINGSRHFFADETMVETVSKTIAKATSELLAIVAAEKRLWIKLGGKIQ